MLTPTDHATRSNFPPFLDWRCTSPAGGTRSRDLTVAAEMNISFNLKIKDFGDDLSKR